MTTTAGVPPGSEPDRSTVATVPDPGVAPAAGIGTVGPADTGNEHQAVAGAGGGRHRLSGLIGFQGQGDRHPGQDHAGVERQ